MHKFRTNTRFEDHCLVSFKSVLSEIVKATLIYNKHVYKLQKITVCDSPSIEQSRTTHSALDWSFKYIGDVLNSTYIALEVKMVYSNWNVETHFHLELSKKIMIPSHFIVIIFLENFNILSFIFNKLQISNTFFMF